MIGTPRAEMHGAGAIRSRSRDHAAYTLGVPVRLYVHLTWTTLQRQPLINHGVADFLRRFLPREAKRHGARLLASGVVADHVHVVLQLPPVTNIPRLIQGLKGASARQEEVAEPRGRDPPRRNFLLSRTSLGLSRD